MRHAASLDIGVLVVVCRGRVEPGRRLPPGGEARRDRFLAIGVLDPAQPSRRIRVRDADLVDHVDVVDKAGIVLVIERCPDREIVRQAEVDGRTELIAGAFGFGIFRQFRASLDRNFAELRAAGNVADCAAQRSCAVERTLGPQQNLDPLEVVELQVHEQRYFADVGSDRTAAVVIAVARADRVEVETANDDRVALSSPAVDDVDARHEGQQVRQFGQPLLRNLLASDGRDVERNVLHALGAASGGHDDLVRGNERLLVAGPVRFGARRFGRQVLRLGLLCACRRGCDPGDDRRRQQNRTQRGEGREICHCESLPVLIECVTG